MPIRINLLAEEQALEELRRKDPVKRVILAGIILTALVLAWSVWLVGQAMVVRSELTNLESKFNSGTNEYWQIIQNKNTLDDDKMKLAALDRIATNRFLNGNLLNTLQRLTHDNVQLVRFKVTQTYLTEETKARVAVSDDDRPAPAGPKPPGLAAEKIAITLNARDNSPEPGGALKGFQDMLSTAPYFTGILGRTNEFHLTARGNPQTDPDGKAFVLFTLDAQLPEKKR